MLELGKNTRKLPIPALCFHATESLALLSTLSYRNLDHLREESPRKFQITLHFFKEDYLKNCFENTRKDWFIGVMFLFWKI